MLMYLWLLYHVYYQNLLVCILHFNNSDMKYRIIFKTTIFILCLTFVVERSVHCFTRFLNGPQAVEIKMSDGSSEIMPHFTFCAEDRYNQTVLEECGLTM